MNNKMCYLLLFLLSFYNYGHAQKEVSLDLELRASSGETFKLQNVLEVDYKAIMIVYKEASCCTCVDKTHYIIQKVVDLFSKTVNIYMLSTYNSVRTQKILETRLNLQNKIYHCNESDILDINASNTPIIMLLDSTGTILKIELIDDRKIDDIMGNIYDWFN